MSDARIALPSFVKADVLPKRNWNLLFSTLNFVSFVVGLIVVLVVVGFGGSHERTYYTDFPGGSSIPTGGGEVGFVNSSSLLKCDFPLLCKTDVNDFDFRVVLASLLMRAVYSANASEINVAGEWDANTDLYLAKFQEEWLYYSPSNPNYGCFDALTWKVLTGCWDVTDDARCGYQCAIEYNNSIPWNASLGPNFDPYAECCADLKVVTVSGWKEARNAERQQYAEDNSLTALDCAVPTVFLEGSCLYIGCFEIDVSRKRFVPATQVQQISLPPTPLEFGNGPLSTHLREYDYHLFGLVIVLPLILALMHLLEAYLFNNAKYSELEKDKNYYVLSRAFAKMVLAYAYNPVRWVTLSMVTALTCFVVSQLAGITHIYLLVMFTVFTIQIQMLFYYHEWINRRMCIELENEKGWFVPALKGGPDAGQIWSPWWLAAFINAFRATIVLAYFFMGVTDGSGSVPWYAWAVVLGVSIAHVLPGLISMMFYGLVWGRAESSNWLYNAPYRYNLAWILVYNLLVTYVFWMTLGGILWEHD